MQDNANQQLPTAERAEPMDGDKLYQQRARATLPLLVRQAEAGTPIYYSDLARELGIPNHRHLGLILGSIGQSIELLSKQWNEEIPPIQSLVINKRNDIPGDGVGWFLIKEEDFSALSLKRRREIVQAILQKVYAYPKWREVLAAFSLSPVDPDFSAKVVEASKPLGHGESEGHKTLKELIANHPKIIGLPPSPHGKIEVPIASGDFLDVSFERRNVWVAAEVKSDISTEADIIRGIFQCVKYQAVMEAMLIAKSQSPNVRTILVLQGTLTPALVALKNTLGVQVIENAASHQT